MLALSLSQIEETSSSWACFTFDLFGVSSRLPRRAMPPLSREDIFDIDDEIAQHDSDDDSSSVSDSDPVDQRVSPAMRGTASSSCSEHTWTFSHEVETIAPSLELAGERGDQKQLSVGFYQWSSTRVAGQCRPCSQKDGKVRVCVDFRDLNKASPKDDFPLPHIDMLVDSTAGHSMLSFMDGFSGYSQILMAPEDMEKTSFITEWGTYCYRVMPFGLKNAGATYQRAATTLP
ncbi:Transposon Ty3-I Gag-Pol polyprotein [Vitis vinifera]|uniref:Transposon Ty3-I Gag-Pol polyprotein n=1 Tax=Vitis vinifera TaxID=29760 RepID=A0A438IJH3_VITVI|nr:Transposon Ty3-I Gag-Pol polyprotein [Vitis vinifera]